MVTLFTADIACAVRFYRALGFVLRYGGESADFTSFHVGSGYLNLALGPPPERYWGERYFHVRDPDRHELSFARPL